MDWEKKRRKGIHLIAQILIDIPTPKKSIEDGESAQPSAPNGVNKTMSTFKKSDPNEDFETYYKKVCLLWNKEHGPRILDRDICKHFWEQDCTPLECVTEYASRIVSVPTRKV